ncbi:hypothetical protein EDD29_5274 [Actinocorallia herbida]|uniref:Uncharacterized protein n=1 Tax=Actinocorallia herbida TaxID=58109 RepID=A0A3N1D2D5_9ACTN|nr:hypothetical protein [Actinocorallia herbida]ROO87650.1 hypothetical protein EDD29_5274 [Actinocorallia herbida]
MVNTKAVGEPRRLRFVSAVVTVYVAIVIGTVAALGAMSSAAPEQATDEAWGHALVVLVFAILLPVRLRSARSGNTKAVRALGIIAAVLLVVNLVEAALPGVFPAWMRVEMAAIALLMLAMLVLVRRSARR